MSVNELASCEGEMGILRTLLGIVGVSGAPRVQYTRTYVLIPPTYGSEWVWAATAGSYEGPAPTRYTIGSSADDAAIGSLDTKIIIAINSHEWGPGEDGRGLRGFYEKYYDLPPIGSVSKYYNSIPVASGFILKEWGVSSPADLTSRLLKIQGVADGFDPPVGSETERQRLPVWPDDWFNANPYGRYYVNSTTGHAAYHTGADLNLNIPYWDADRGAPVYAAADGVVTAAGWYPIWGNIIVLKHLLFDPITRDEQIIYTRYAHLADMKVVIKQKVFRGQYIADIGQDAGGGPYHLHFDISPTEALRDPEDWPGLDINQLVIDYVDPELFIRSHRPLNVLP